MLTRKRAILFCAGAILVAAAVFIGMLVARATAPVSAAASVVTQAPESTAAAARPLVTAAPHTLTAIPSPSFTPTAEPSPPSEPQFSEPAPPAAAAPVVKRAPSPAPPPARRVCPSGLVNAALTSVSFSPYQYDAGNRSVVTVKGSVTNDTTAVVTVWDDDVPNCQ